MALPLELHDEIYLLARSPMLMPDFKSQYRDGSEQTSATSNSLIQGS